MALSADQDVVRATVDHVGDGKSSRRVLQRRGGYIAQGEAEQREGRILQRGGNEIVGTIRSGYGFQQGTVLTHAERTIGPLVSDHPTIDGAVLGHGRNSESPFNFKGDLRRDRFTGECTDSQAGDLAATRMRFAGQQEDGRAVAIEQAWLEAGQLLQVTL